MKTIKGIDLFCGVGGLTNGLQSAGIKIKVGFDIDETCRKGFEINNKAKFISKDIRSIQKDDILPFLKGADYTLIAGCAPCQAYSNYQKNKSFDEITKHKKYGLINEFIRIIEDVKPDFVTMENVPQLRKDPLFIKFIESIERNYKYYKCEVINIANYGAAQNRKRLIFIASNIGPLEIPKGFENKKSIFEVIGHLPELKMGEVDKFDPLHKCSKLNETNMERIKNSKPGGTWRDWPKNLLPDCYLRESGKTFSSVYGRVSPNKPSGTITTQFNRYGSGRFGHYKQNRAFSLREGALLQTFPSDYDFCITDNVPMTAIARQIGNAVPPIIGKVIGEIFINSIKK